MTQRLRRRKGYKNYQYQTFSLKLPMALQWEKRRRHANPQSVSIRKEITLQNCNAKRIILILSRISKLEFGLQ